MTMKILRMMICFVSTAFCLFEAITSAPVDDEAVRIRVRPEYLNSLLRSGKYEEFERLMGIDTPGLSRPRRGNTTDELLLNPELKFGDVLLTPEQQMYTGEEGVRGGGELKENVAYHGTNFAKHPFKKWPKNIPYYISTKFSKQDKRRISKAIRAFNFVLRRCSRWIPCTYHNNYVYIFPGDGCYSALGRVGGIQPLSLEVPGCLKKGIILHEMNHVMGMMHEHCRPDRDDYIDIIWKNISKEWKSQYKKTKLSDVQQLNSYDYYSLMHYSPVGTNGKKVFDIYDPSVDSRQVGRGEDFSWLDISKIRKLYCAKRFRHVKKLHSM